MMKFFNKFNLIIILMFSLNIFFCEEGSTLSPKISLNKEEKFYVTTIEWAQHILKNYHTRFGGNKLIFIGGSCFRAWEAARYLSSIYGVDENDIVYLDFPRSVSRYSDFVLIQKYLEEHGIFDAGDKIAVFDNWSDTGGTLSKVENILTTHSSHPDMIPYLLYSDNFESLNRDFPMKRNEINLAAIFLGKSNWMEVNIRNAELIYYEETNSGVKPRYLNFEQLEKFLAIIDENADILKMDGNILSEEYRELLPLLSRFFLNKGIKNNMKYSPKSLIEDLRALIKANPQDIRKKQDRMFRELVEKVVSIKTTDIVLPDIKIIKQMITST